MNYKSLEDYTTKANAYCKSMYLIDIDDLLNEERLNDSYQSEESHIELVDYYADKYGLDRADQIWPR